MSILALRRSNAKFVEEVRGWQADVAPTPVTTPAPKPFRPAYPGVSRHALDDLRADDAPIPPSALRKSYDTRTWLPTTVGLRSVPLLDDLDDVVAGITRLVADGAYVCLPLRIRLEQVAAMLAEVTA